jgi:hypothetical protein
LKNLIRFILPAVFAMLFFAACSPKTAVTTAVNPGRDTIPEKVATRVKSKDTIPQTEYYRTDYLRYENHVYSGNIRTIQLYRENWEFAIPLITLGTDEKLTLTFDDLDGSLKNYKYTLIHCSASWKPTDLSQAEYLAGLTEDNINEYEYSFNTLQAYTHYTLVFPGDNVRPLLSGNYILKVFLDDNDKTLIFTRRFMVVEPKVSVNMQVKRSTSIDYHDYKQAVDFSINTNDYRIDNPYVDMKVILMQNGRWDNAKYDIKPRFVKGNIYDFNYDEENDFSGGNEFRHFDIKSLHWNSDRIAKFYSDSAGEHVKLMDDIRVTFKNYYSEKDIDGRYLIKSEDHVTNSDVEAEYVWVHFFLRYDAPVIDGSIYVFGALSDWQFLKECQMKYNYDRRGYECALYLKQGYYNFQYVFLENGKTVGDESFIEGMHYETENEYTVLVYNREKATMYDRLIAVQQVNTYTNK